MNALKINRINSKRYLIMQGKEVLRECTSYKEAMNALIAEDMIFLDSFDDFLEGDDYETLKPYLAVA